MSTSSKVFGIGVSKTGTTSLTVALRVLGYEVIHYPRLDRLETLLSFADAATDTSIACCFRELDVRYPESRFILTVRDERTWLTPAARELSRDVSEPWQREVRRRLYGSETWDPPTFAKGVAAHNAEVLAYFTERPRDLLVFNIFEGESWPHLCRFLGKELPDLAFPHENASK
jgi:hypothetical protein